jgi:hypothetical protein
MVFVNSPGTVKLIGILMFSTMFSRRVATRFMVRAFTTNSNGLAPTRGVTAGSHVRQHRFLSVRGVARVEEDLDAALDDLLGDAFKDTEEPLDLEKPKENEAHMKDSHPVPAPLGETVSPLPPYGQILYSDKRANDVICLHCFFKINCFS